MNEYKFLVQLISTDNSGVNVFLVSTSVKGASHTYSRLSWLAKPIACI